MTTDAEAGDPISGVANLHAALDSLELTKHEHAHLRFWFRGQSRPLANWALQPGVYRDALGQDDEAKRLRVEQHLTQDFRVLSAGIRTGHETDAEIYFLQQHYRMPTRLLDWTTSPLAALYFATDHPDDGDGEVIMMDAYQLEKTTASEAVKFEGIATSRHPVFQNALNVIVSWGKTEEFDDFIIPVRPDHAERRIGLQRSCFTFHVPKRPAVTKANNPTLQSWPVLGTAKREIRKQLSLLGINQFTIFGDLDHLAEWLKEAHSLS